MQPILIDTDCGVDDAVALAFALCAPDVCDVRAITCVDGNATLDNVTKNVARVLKHCNRVDVPFYRGCDRALLSPYAGPLHRYEGHGKDGLGDAPEESDVPAPQTQSAAEAMIEHARACEKAGQRLHIVALGPLTNLALASLLDPAFPALLAGVTVMGGTLACQGNTGLASEFNFDVDPEAAQVVLARYGPLVPGGVRIMPWEMFPLTMPWATFDDVFFSDARTNELGVWFRAVLAALVRTIKRDPAQTGVYLSDPLAVLAVLFPNAVKKETALYGVIETGGMFTRGAIAFDWPHSSGKKPNCTLIQEMDYDVYLAHMRRIFCSSSQQ